MKSIMEPIYKYLYEGIATTPIVKQEVDLYGELNDESLAKLLHYSIEERFTNGVEQAFYYLHNPNRKFHSSLNSVLLFKYYYLLSVMHFERYDVIDLNEAFRQCCRYYDEKKLDEEWIYRFNLLYALCKTIEDDKNEALMLGWKWCLWAKERTELPMFSVSIYFGSWAVYKGAYKEADSFLKQSLKTAETIDQKIIALSNLGAFAYARDDLEEAIEYYKRALDVMKSYEANDSDIKKLYIMLLENLKNIESLYAAQKGEFFIPDRIRLIEDDLEHAERMRNIAKRFLIDEVYEENLRGRNSYRVSNNLYEANRYFNKAERSYQLLGHIYGKKWLLEDQIKHYLHVGKALNNDLLQKIALELAILINHDKTIKGLLQNRVPFQSKKQLNEFCDWLFNCGTNRLTRLGRIHCIGYLADYLPEKYIPLALEELLRSLHDKWSFTKDFDFKRSAIKALGHLFPRLNPSEKVDVVTQIWNTIQTDKALVRHQAAKSLLNSYGWENYPIKNLNRFIIELRNFLDSYPENELEYSLLIKLLAKISQFAEEEIQRETAQFLLNKWNKGNIDAILVFLYDNLVKFTDNESRIQIVKKAMEQIEREIKEASTKVISIKAYNWEALLAYFLPFAVETSLFREAENLLIRFIGATNVPLTQRVQALTGIFYLLDKHPNLPLNRDLLRTTCLQYLELADIWIEKDTTFLVDNNNFLAEVFKVLSKLDLSQEQARHLINRFLVTSLRNNKDSLSESLVAITMWAIKWNTDPLIYAPIISRLYLECKNEDESVRATAIASLVKLAKEPFLNDVYKHYILDAIEIGASDSYRIVRYQLAQALTEILRERTNLLIQEERFNAVIETLQSDISYLVQKTVADVAVDGKKVNP